MNVLYTAEGTAWGGRQGRAVSSDGNLAVDLVRPKELGGPGGAGTNPEQLFAVGYAGCFHSALQLVARTEKIDITDSAVTVRISLAKDDAGAFAIVAEIEAEIPTVSREEAQALVEKAHAVCPYSNATRGNVNARLIVTES
ncbi:MAG: lipoyl-dependent peroxiredoxin [Acidimicrobiia bacterium]|nr:lipoyl-dependent peroxiredoxin [Acidimicrobiia bacterium]